MLIEDVHYKNKNEVNITTYLKCVSEIRINDHDRGMRVREALMFLQ